LPTLLFEFKGHLCHSWNGLVKQAQDTHKSAKESIKLTTSNRNELECITKPVVIAKGAANHVKQNWLDVSQGLKVPVVNEFSDAFFEELPVMPPDCDIKFVIELVYGTASMFKSPYRMAAKQLAKLQDQIKELLETSHIHPSSTPWGAPMIFVLKKDGTQQMRVYYHDLNEVTIENKHRCLGLVIYLINFVVCVCSLKSIFD
jgi:hypothetical protein